MDEFKGTPGPWPSPSFTCAPYSIWCGDTQIATCRWTDDDGRTQRECVQNDSESRANAKLIAAAPDLLEALQEAALLLEACGPVLEQSGSPQYNYGSKMARAAIAKALK